MPSRCPGISSASPKSSFICSAAKLTASARTLLHNLAKNVLGQANVLFALRLLVSRENPQQGTAYFPEANQLYAMISYARWSVCRRHTTHCCVQRISSTKDKLC